MFISLIEKQALVCGASSGIGKATAIELAKNGCSVTILARRADELQKVLAELSTDFGQHHHALSVDIQDEFTLINTVKNHVENVGTIHILVNNTGGPAAGPLLESTVDQLKQAFHNHILVAHQLTKILVPNMQQAGYGRVINIVSTSVKQPIDNLGVSNTIRGAMASWSKTMATELGKYGITVNNVLPGATETDRLTAIVQRTAANSGQSEEQVAEHMVKEIPAQRFGKPEEVANAVAFLASEAAAYINGTSILVDGGRTRALS